MNLKELKSMIAEEYSNYLAEQEDPAVAVSDVDVDADGGDENAEETLRDIYDMLKDYFEGGDADADADADAGADAGADDAYDAGDEEELNEKKTTPPGAGSGPCNQPCPGGVGFTGPKGSGCLPCGTHTHIPGKRGDKRPKSTKPMPTNPHPMSENNLQERFKKLANIIKG